MGILDYYSLSFYWCHRTRIDQTLVCVGGGGFRKGVSPKGNVYSHFKLYYEETDAGAENQDSRCEWVSEWMSEQAIEWVSKREYLSPPFMVRSHFGSDWHTKVPGALLVVVLGWAAPSSGKVELPLQVVGVRCLWLLEVRGHSSESTWLVHLCTSLHFELPFHYF